VSTLLVGQRPSTRTRSITRRFMWRN